MKDNPDSDWLKRSFEQARNHLVLTDLQRYGTSQTVDRLEVLDCSTGKEYIFTNVKISTARASDGGNTLRLVLESWADEHL